jgi:hypothetical protein
VRPPARGSGCISLRCASIGDRAFEDAVAVGARSDVDALLADLTALL